MDNGNHRYRVESERGDVKGAGLTLESAMELARESANEAGLSMLVLDEDEGGVLEEVIGSQCDDNEFDRGSDRWRA